MRGNITIEQRQEGRSRFFQLHYEGKPVSRLWVHDLEVRFGEAVLRMGGIGGVETEEAYRKRGFARRLLETACDYMREAGFDVAGLFGIPNFYERWGFVPALPEYRVTVPRSHLESATLSFQVANFEPEHRLEVLRIYEENNRYRFCSVVRRPEQWNGFPIGAGWFVKADVKVFITNDRQVVGYLSLDDVAERTTVAEVGYATPAVFESMAAFLCQRAQEFGHDLITLHLPPDHLFALYLRRYGCTVQQEFFRSGDGMMRIVNLEQTMQKMQEELTRRWRTAPFRPQVKGVAIVTDIGTVTIATEGERITVVPGRVAEATGIVEMPQEKLTQLLTGYQVIDSFCTDPAVRCDEAVKPLLRTLFPPAYPYIWWADRF